MSTTKIYKSAVNGWTATTRYDMPEIGERKFLELSTLKLSQGLKTTASVHTQHEDGSGYTTIIFQDFYATVNTSKARATAKAVETLHDEAKQNLQVIKEAALKHYNKG